MATIKELLVRYKGDTKGLEEASRRAEASIGALQVKTQAAAAKMGGAFRALNGAMAPLLSIYGALQAIGLADQFIAMETRLKNVTTSADEYNSVLNNLYVAAQENGQELGTLIDTYQKLNISLPESIKNTYDLTKVTELLARGFAASGTTAQTASGAILQLTQGLASDFQASAQEINSIIDGAPLVAKLISEQLGGKSAVELKKFAQEGRLTADTFIQALLAAEDAIKAFEIPQTVSLGVTRLRNEVLLLVNEINKLVGSTDGALNVLDFMNDRLVEMRQTTKLLSPTFRLVGAEINQILNDVAVKIRDVVIKTRLAINDLSRGLIDIDISDQAQIFDKDYTSQIESAKQEIRGITDEIKKYNEGQQSLAKTATEINVQLGKQKLSEKELSKLKREEEKQRKEALEEIKSLLEDQRKAQQELNNSISDTFISFKDGVVSGESAMDSLRKTALNVINDIANNLIRMNFGGSVSGGLGGTIAQALGGFIGIGSTPNYSYNPATTAPPRKPSFASGGSFMVQGNAGIDRNTLSLNGQPIANVGKGETIAVAKSGNGGVTVNQTINVTTGVQQTVQAEITRFLPRFKQLSVEAVGEAQYRGQL